MRGSLETPDPAKAELLRQRVELEAALLDPRFQAAGLPAGIAQLMHGAESEGEPAQPPAPVIVQTAPAPPQPKTTRVGIDAALKAYLDFIRIENSPHHVAGKLSMMRRFFGRERIDALAGKPPVMTTPASPRFLRAASSMKSPRR